MKSMAKCKWSFGFFAEDKESILENTTYMRLFMSTTNFANKNSGNLVNPEENVNQAGKYLNNNKKKSKDLVQNIVNDELKLLKKLDVKADTDMYTNKAKLKKMTDECKRGTKGWVWWPKERKSFDYAKYCLDDLTTLEMSRKIQHQVKILKMMTMFGTSELSLVYMQVLIESIHLIW